MPSDELVVRALAALARSRNTFHTAVVAAVDEVSAFLAQQRAPAAERAGQEAVRLGAFGADRLDVERFSRIVDAGEVIDDARLRQLEHAVRVLRSFAAQGDELHRIVLRRGADLRDTVRDALAVRGRAFNTAHQIEILRTGRTGMHVELEYGTLDFRHWTRAERLLAPPLVVQLHGADLQPAGLSEYMDGAQKIVLVVDGPCAAAPLSRLIAPGTFVMQTTDAAAVDRLAAFDGPGIAAVVPQGCAAFTHDPSRGASLAQRLSIELLPPAPARTAGVSARQQAEELTWLAELSRLAAQPIAVSTASGSAAAAVAVPPADHLAAWLLRQAELAPAE
jgi:hypothetical protein